MSKEKVSMIRSRQVLPAILAGAAISLSSAIAYANSGEEMPAIAGAGVGMIAVAVFPGYIVSAYITNNIHDANLILAGFINFILYGSLSLWLLSWRSRKRSA